MKKSKHTLPILGMLVLSSLPLIGQVSFTNQGNLLGNTSGFSYEDCAVDMNGDYLDDVVRVVNNGMYIDYQQADGSFIQEYFDIDFQNQPSWSICAGDIDGNGFNDLLFGDGNRVSFVYANETGTAYTEDAHPEYIFSQRSTFADIDNDGHLDAFVCHDVDQSHPYRNDGNGNLILDQSLIETIDQPGNYAAIWCDYDNDNDIDLYVTKCRGGAPPGDPTRTNRMYRNNGDGTYSEIAADINMDDNSQSWSTVFEDFDHDGDFDAFIVNHDFTNRFMRNEGDGTFTEIIDQTGIDKFDLGAWENASGDFDNDGHVDILSELGDELYMGNGDLTFTGISAPVSGGGIGDFNNDGFLDVISGNALWINEGNDNNWVKISLQGILSNANGIGARIEIYGSWGVQVREIRSGQSFSPMSTLNAHFGLGTADVIDQIIVKWPSGTVTLIDDPEINTAHLILESDCLLPETPLTVTGDTELCPGETTEISAPAGYTYQWSNGETSQNITVSESGVYSVIIEDGDGCLGFSETVVISIIEETMPEITAMGDETFCLGGSVTLTSTEAGGYTWPDGSSTQSIEVFESGTYYVLTDPVCPGDQLQSNSIDVTVLDAPLPEVMDVTTNPGNSVTLEATGDNLEWYDAPTGGTLLGTGNTYETMPITETTTYYVESHTAYPGALQEGGKEDFSGPGGLPSTGGYSYFDVWEPFTLLTVEVFVPVEAPAGIRTVQLVDENDQVLEEKTFDLTQGNHTLDLNFDIEPGTGYSLRLPEANLFRNSSQVSYPYPIGTVGELTNSLYGQNYYYYFYSWQIQLPSYECVSERVAVTITLTGTEEVPGYGILSGFPNPTSEMLYIRFDSQRSGTAQLQLQDVLGRTLEVRDGQEVLTGENLYEFDLSELPAGMYQVQLNIDGKTAIQKIVKQ